MYVGDSIAMMGVHQPQDELFSYKVNLDKRVRADHPLRRVGAIVDFNFIRAEVAATENDVPSILG